jgi:hypothetical protein
MKRVLVNYCIFAVSVSRTEIIMNIHFHSLRRNEEGPIEYERMAFQQFYDAGVLLVAAAGNDYDSQYNWPASHDSVISVAGRYYLLKRCVLYHF